MQIKTLYNVRLCGYTKEELDKSSLIVFFFFFIMRFWRIIPLSIAMTKTSGYPEVFAVL